MPKLDGEKRKSINERLALHEELRGHYKDHQYTSQYCHLCNWASNGLTLEEAIEANEKHEATHPETVQIDASQIGIGEICDSLHDHECLMDYCTCKCGCHIGPFCTLVFGSLCSVCFIQAQRGNNNHGEKILCVEH